MRVDKKDLGKKTIELTFEITSEEFAPFLTQAAEYISQNKNIKGFRPGKAPYDIVVKEVGEMAIYQSASQDALAKYYFDYIEAENLETIDQPDIKVVKLAPGNPFIFTATTALMPEVKIKDFKNINVAALPEIKIEETEVTKVLADLRKMRRKQILMDKTAAKGDLVEIDFNVFVDNVAIDGGQAKKYPLELGSDSMIPGFEDNIVGMKAGEGKEFELAFPEKYHAANLAGKKAVFKIKVIGVHTYEMPEATDAFAKDLGFKDLANMKLHIEASLKKEKEDKAKSKQEVEVVEKAIEHCDFEDLPDQLVNQEAHKMVHELEDNVARQGLKFDDYLAHIKKKESDLMLDFTPDAIKRVKTGLLMRALAKEHQLEATKEEVAAEVEKTLAGYKLNPQYAGQLADLEKNVRSENAARYFGNLIVNRKALAWLKQQIVK